MASKLGDPAKVKEATEELKLGEKAKVDPAKLMRYLTDHPEAQFSPNGVLKTSLAGMDRSPAARPIFEALFGVIESWMPSDEPLPSAGR